MKRTRRSSLKARYVDDGTLTPNDFRADPTMVLPLMDAALEQRK